MTNEVTDRQFNEENGYPEEDGGQHVSLLIRHLLADRRIDKYLKHRFPDFSRTLIQHLIREQAVKVNDKPVKCSYRLDPGDRVDVLLPPAPTNEIKPENIPLDVIYEDDYMLAINKQANLIIHPARGNKGGTLVNGLVYYSNSLSTVNGQFRPGIVHRLDRNTTGVLVIAKTDTAHWRLAHQFEYRQTRKEYLAIVHGTMELDADVVDMPLGRHPMAREKYAIRPESGKSAVTTYQVIKQYRGYALVLLQPKTGRTHQLRVHMSYIKHPIVGDIMYGGKTMTLRQLANLKPLDETLPVDKQTGDPGWDDEVVMRPMLHAHRLHIRHPVSGAEMTFEAPLPKDFQQLIALLDHYRKLGS